MSDFPIFSKRFKIKYSTSRTGEYLIDAVKRVTLERDGGNPRRYYQERRYEDGYLYRIGRRGDDEKSHLFISARDDNRMRWTDWITPAHLYCTFEVVSVVCTSDIRLMQSCENEELIALASSFAELLEDELTIKPVRD